MPRDAHDILALYAVAARVVAAKPECLGDVTHRLALVTRDLVPPESLAAAECSRLWMLFARLAQAASAHVRTEAGKALVRDLDGLGQRLELMPLSGWDKLPQYIDDPKAVSVEQSEVTSSGDTLETIRARAKASAAEAKQGLVGSEVAKLVRALAIEEREKLLVRLVSEGAIGRSEGQLLVRWLAKGGALSADDEALDELLANVGKWLSK